MNLPEFHTQHVFIGHGAENDHLLFRQVVSDMPYLVHLSTAGDGEEIMNMLNQFSELPDLVVLDLNLSGKNGLECLAGIKENKKLASLPVVIYSATSYPAAINQLYELGAHLYIYKTEDVLVF